MTTHVDGVLPGEPGVVRLPPAAVRPTAVWSQPAPDPGCRPTARYGLGFGSAGRLAAPRWGGTWAPPFGPGPRGFRVRRPLHGVSRRPVPTS